jgi:hypothetical protein
MKFRIVVTVIIEFFVFKNTFAQDYCKRKLNRFDKRPSEFASDFYNLKVSANIVRKNNAQVEVAPMVLNIPKSYDGGPVFPAGTCLIRYGLLERLELRGGLSVFESNRIKIPENGENPISIPFYGGVKVALLYYHKSYPVLSALPEIVWDRNNSKTFKLGSIIDLRHKNIFRFSCYTGVQTPSELGNIFQYSFGFDLYSNNSNIGFYFLATNRFPYLDDLLNVGLLYKTSGMQITLGYGVHEDNGSILAGISWRIGNDF